MKTLRRSTASLLASEKCLFEVQASSFSTSLMDYDSDAAWSLNPLAAVVSSPFMLSPLTWVHVCVTYVCQVPTGTASQTFSLDDTQKQRRGLKHPPLTAKLCRCPAISPLAGYEIKYARITRCQSKMAFYLTTPPQIKMYPRQDYIYINIYNFFFLQHPLTITNK